MSRARTTPLAWTLCGLAFVTLGLGVALPIVAGTGPATLLREWVLASVAMSASFGLVGAVIASHRPENPVAWLFCALSVAIAVTNLARQYGSAGLDLPAPGWAAVVTTCTPEVIMGLLVATVLLYPHGRLPSARWRPALGATILVQTGAVALAAVSPFAAVSATPFPTVDNPLAVLELAVARPLRELVATATLLLLLIATTSVVVRLRGPHDATREQVKWFAFAAAIACLGVVGMFTLDRAAGVVVLVTFPLVPLAAGLAILRYRLYDIDRVVSRTVSYALLSALLAGLYLAAVMLATRLTSLVGVAGDLAVAAATLLAAAVFRPGRRRIQASVDRRFNRARYDARREVAAFRGRLQEQVDLEQVAADLLTATDRALQPTRSALWLHDGRGPGR